MFFNDFTESKKRCLWIRKKDKLRDSSSLKIVARMAHNSIRISCCKLFCWILCFVDVVCNGCFSWIEALSLSLPNFFRVRCKYWIVHQFTGRNQEKDQDKWTHVLSEIDRSLKTDNYTAALQLVDKFLTDCKTPELQLKALMKKAQGCLDAWQDTRKFLSTPFHSFFSCLLFSL